MDAAIANDVEAFEKRLLGDGSPFALTGEYPAGSDVRLYRNGPQTLNDVYRKAALLEKNILVVEAGERITYGEIFRRADRLAHALAGEFGIGRGTRVALAMKDGSGWIVCFIAVTKLGAVAVLAGDETDLQRRCGATGCTLTMTAPGIVTDLRDGRSLSLDALFALADGQERPILWAANDDEAVIAFTSGSMSFPKAVALTQRGMITGLLNMMFAGALANFSARENRPKLSRPQAPCVLLLAPLSHISGYGQMLLTLMIGGKLVFPATDQAVDILHCINRENVTSLAGANPAIIDALLNSISAGHAAPSLASLSINGCVVHPHLVAEIEAILPGVLVNTGYGMTETNGAICAIAGAELKRRPRSCGRLVPAVACRITDDRGNALLDEEAGLVWLKGAMLMRGYCGDTEPFEDGWLNTGDRGYLSADRHLHILDRQEDFITTASGHISAGEIERALVGRAGITEASIICGSARAIPAIFVLSPNPADRDGLQKALATRFGEFPHEFFSLAEFPRTLSGKIDRRCLKSRFLGG